MYRFLCIIFCDLSFGLTRAWQIKKIHCKYSVNDKRTLQVQLRQTRTYGILKQIQRGHRYLIEGQLPTIINSSFQTLTMSFFLERSRIWTLGNVYKPGNIQFIWLGQSSCSEHLRLFSYCPFKLCLTEVIFW